MDTAITSIKTQYVTAQTRQAALRQTVQTLRVQLERAVVDLKVTDAECEQLCQLLTSAETLGKSGAATVAPPLSSPQIPTLLLKNEKCMHSLIYTSIAAIDDVVETKQQTGLKFKTLAEHGLRLPAIRRQLAQPVGLWFAHNPKHEQMFIDILFKPLQISLKVHEICDLKGLTAFKAADRGGGGGVDITPLDRVAQTKCCAYHSKDMKSPQCAEVDAWTHCVWVLNYMSHSGDAIVRQLTTLYGREWTALNMYIISTKSCRNTRFEDGRRIFTELAVRVVTVTKA